MDFFTSFMHCDCSKATNKVTSHKDEINTIDFDSEPYTIVSCEKEEIKQSNVFSVSGRLHVDKRDILDELTEIRNLLVLQQIMTSKSLKKFPIEICRLIRDYV